MKYLKKTKYNQLVQIQFSVTEAQLLAIDLGRAHLHQTRTAFIREAINMRLEYFERVERSALQKNERND